MSNLNHIAAKPLVKKENSLRLSRAWLGWWQLRQSRPLSALVFLTQVMTGDTWFGGGSNYHTHSSVSRFIPREWV